MEDVKKIIGVKFEYQCIDEHCVKTNVKMTIFTNENSNSYEMDWDDVTKWIGDLNHMNNINMMRKYSEDLKEISAKTEAENIMEGWNNDFEIGGSE